MSDYGRHTPYNSYSVRLPRYHIPLSLFEWMHAGLLHKCLFKDSHFACLMLVRDVLLAAFFGIALVVCGALSFIARRRYAAGLAAPSLIISPAAVAPMQLAGSTGIPIRALA